MVTGCVSFFTTYFVNNSSNAALKFEVFMAVKLGIVVFSVVTTCNLVGSYRFSSETLPPARLHSLSTQRTTIYKCDFVLNRPASL
jgi:hypothetical protein